MTKRRKKRAPRKARTGCYGSNRPKYRTRVVPRKRSEGITIEDYIGWGCK